MLKDLNNKTLEKNEIQEKKSISDFFNKKITGIILATSILTINPEEVESPFIFSPEDSIKKNSTTEVVEETQENIKDTIIINVKSIDSLYLELDERIREQDSLLSETEITQLYNGGAGITFAATTPNVTLFVPESVQMPTLDKFIKLFVILELSTLKLRRIPPEPLVS